ncbi:hypothetical protein BS47DRAFT_1342534 [Hydnum rufescens UP504]|uniref:Uncharacterized protein n=1 Tax=Hydnum rufescens UP504 TaxID=1448309 RepID=A0A9P6DXS6_9AGAM|nr:hypothetical protein BS47DRAFT_1342534 [Hydnum rufescens UP504]
MPLPTSQPQPASQNDPFLEVPQTPGNSSTQLLKELVPNPSDVHTVANKLLEFIRRMKAWRSAMHVPPNIHCTLICH